MTAVPFASEAALRLVAARGAAHFDLFVIDQHLAGDVPSTHPTPFSLHPSVSSLALADNV